MSSKPNILLFLVDDMGPMDTSVPMLTDESGEPRRYPLNDWYRTPSMERLAAQGVRFSDFYAHTVCSPSRVSIMTGQNSARHHTTDMIHAYSRNGGRFMPPDWNWEGLKKSDVTLPSILRKQGLKTLHIGKAHFGPCEHEGADPLNIGFDVNIGGAAIGRPGSYYAEEGYGKGTECPVPHLEKYHDTDIHLTEALTLKAKSELDKAIAEGKPFFLYMSHYAVHGPFSSDPRFAANYRDGDMDERAQAYATLIEGMDKSLGDLMDHLEATGVAEDTLILFLSDNGGDAPIAGWNDVASSAPLRGRKGTRWEGGVRVPFLAAWAKPNPDNHWQQKLPIVSGTICTEFGACFDLFPTILELIDQPVPADHPVDGRSLQKIFAGEPDPGRRYEFLSHSPHPRNRGTGNDYFTIYVNGNWKVLYRYLDGGERFELYDLQADPSESDNLAASNPEKLKSMLEAMMDELEAKGALYPEKDGRPVTPVILQ